MNRCKKFRSLSLALSLVIEMKGEYAMAVPIKPGGGSYMFFLQPILTRFFDLQPRSATPAASVVAGSISWRVPWAKEVPCTTFQRFIDSSTDPLWALFFPGQHESKWRSQPGCNPQSDWVYRFTMQCVPDRPEQISIHWQNDSRHCLVGGFTLW